MKKFFNNIFTLSLGLSLGLLASCDDVPAPYELNLEGGTATEQKVSSKENPYTVADALADYKLGKVANQWVKGYIVGYLPANNSVMSAAQFCSADTAAQTNLVLAASASETLTDNCMAVQLPAGEIRTALNVKDHADNIGKEVLLYGSIEKYCGAAGIKSVSYCVIDGKSYGTEPGIIVPVGEVKGKGTEAEPWNVAGIVTYCKSLAADVNSASDVWFTGIVSKTTDISTQYNNCTFYISEDGTTSSTQFYVFRCLGLNKGTVTSADLVEVGDTVTVCGKVVNYKGNTPETVQKEAWLTKIQKKDGKIVTPPTPSLEAGNGTFASPYNTPRALALIKAGKITADSVYVAGKVVGTPAVKFDENGLGTYTISLCGIDSTKFQIVGGLALGGDKFTDEEDIMPGDSLIIYGVLNTETGLKGSRIVSQNGEVAGIYTPPTPSGDYTTSLTWTNVKNAYNDNKGTVNGVEDVVIYKLSKSAEGGEAKVTVPSGVSKIGFYAVGWKGSGTSTKVKVGDAEITIAANEGATSNSPFTLTVTESDYYEVEVAVGDVTFACDKRVLLWAINPVK